MAEMNPPVGELVAPQAPIALRLFTRQDIPFGLKLTQTAGWNQTAADWQMLLEQSRTGSFIAMLDGTEAGTVTTVSYQDRLHWIGMVLVAEEYRRRGIGRALLERAIASVVSQGVVCLDATPAGKRLYERLGFQEIYELARYLRKPVQLRPQPASMCQPLTPERLPWVVEYDLTVFGVDRSAILTALQGRTPQLAFYAEQEGKLTGYCLGREGSRYTQIGPVVADSLEVARNLLLTALQNVQQQEVIVDAAFHQPGWNEFLGELGFINQRPLTRMSLGTFVLSEQHSKQLAIAGPEIG